MHLPHVKIEISPNAALPRLMLVFVVLNEGRKACSGLNFSSLYLLHSKRLTFSSNQLYQKYERALPGNIHR
jgi:hypothetical protein